MKVKSASGSLARRKRSRNRSTRRAKRSGWAPDLGACAECKKHDGHVIVRSTHFLVCHGHRAYWCVGVDLYWRAEDQATREADLLDWYTEVEPYTIRSIRRPRNQRPKKRPTSSGARLY